MIVREASPNDASAIVAIRQHVVDDPFITFTTHVPDIPSVQSEIAAARQDDIPFLIAEQADTILGFATWRQFRPGPGYQHSVEHSVHLTPKARGQGGGRQLMHALIERAKATGVHVMIAGISGSNPGAIQFHARLGFAEVGRLPETGFKNDALLDLVFMQLILGPDIPTKPG